MKNQLALSEEEKLVNKNHVLVHLSVWLGMFAIWMILRFLLAPGDATGGIWKAIYPDVMSALTSALVLGVLLEYINRSNLKNNLSRVLTDLFYGSPKILDAVDRQTRGGFVEASLKSILGCKEGEALFHGIVAQYLTSRLSFRTKYDNTITCRDAIHSTPEGIDLTFPVDKYIWVNQSLKYAQSSWADSQVETALEINIALDSKTLDEFFKSERVVFRDILQLCGTERDALSKLSTNQLEALVKKYFNLSVENKVNGQKIPYRVSWGSCIASNDHIVILTDSVNLQDNFTLGISCGFPSKKKITHFFAAVAQPTDSPSIAFHKSESMSNLSFTPMFTGSCLSNLKPQVLGGEHDPSGLILAPNGWVFPMSGVVFVWDYD